MYNFFFLDGKSVMSMFCNVMMLLLLYVHICVTRTGWKTRPWPITVILSIKRSINQSINQSPRNSANICLVEHKSFSTLEGGMSATSFLHSSFLQAINAVMLWPVHVQNVPQASEHLCPAKLQTRCDICSACQSFCPFIPIDSGVPRTVDPQTSL